MTDRRSKSSLLAWGIAPASGTLTIEIRRPGQGFRKLARVRVREGGVFTRKLGVSGDADLRARVAGRSSLVWSEQGRARDVG